MEENMKNEENVGIVKISDEVVSVIAGIAASEIEGIVGMSQGVVGGITQMFTGKKNASNGVKVNVVENNVTIDLYVLVEYGIKIHKVCEKVQQNVIKTVETMTGLKVDAVNIYVQNVIIPKVENDFEEEITEEFEEE